MIKKILLALFLLLALFFAALAIYLSQVNNYQSDGTIQLAVLDAPVRVLRDEGGVPYIFAESFDDALRAQGFVTAQDRLFQIEFTKYLVSGRLAELLGPAGVKSDTQMRVMGIPRHGREHAALLGGKSRRHMELYLEGLNAYIETRRNEHPLGFKLLGIEAQPWTLEESMALRYFLSWASTPNVEQELISQLLIDRLGIARAAQISQLSVNPDGEVAVSAGDGYVFGAPVGLQLAAHEWPDVPAQRFALGSNQWVVGPQLSTTGSAIFVNNPHIDSRSLPGIWHPLALITPEFRAVGAAGPGTVGFAVGRTGHIAFGVTNSDGDGIDLFVEQLDPDNAENYLDEGLSVPFEIIDEVIRVRNRKTGGYDEQPLRIRLTKRGPVISDHGLALADGRVISARWAAPEDMNPDVGELGPLLATSVADAAEKIGRVTAPYNYVVADRDGNIGHFTAGRVPVRTIGNGSLPLPAQANAWDGLIPWNEMPGRINPPRGWVGNANNRTLDADYPYEYSTSFAHTWRYRRMLQLLDDGKAHSAEDHWRFTQDVGNTLAQRVAPLMVTALQNNDSSDPVAAVLADWDYIDAADAVAPALYQSTWRHFARRVYEDELGTELTARMLESNYYWEDRLWSFMAAGDSPWFDDLRTPAIETMNDLLVLAAADAQTELQGLLGPDVNGWEWGKLHTVTFFSPIAPGDMAAQLLGGGTFPKAGSGETLNRGRYKFNTPYRATFIDSLRFVADMGDDEKVMAILSGGTSGRQFDPHLKDQMQKWLTGEANYWWFSDAAIEAHAQSELVLMPE